MTRVLPPPKFLRLAEKGRSSRLFGYPPGEENRVAGYARAVSGFVPFLFLGGRCLVRSLVTYAFLKKKYPDLEIAFGVRKMGRSKLAGHAWLQREKNVVFEPPEAASEYEVLFTHA